MAEVVRAKEHEIIHKGDQLSTHDYFIVSGIMMCYVEQGNDKLLNGQKHRGLCYSRICLKGCLVMLNLRKR